MQPLAPGVDSRSAPLEHRSFYKFEKFLFVLLVGLLVWPYAVALRTRALGYMNDDGVYVVTAKALAEGRGYNIISLPQIIPETKFPVLFPLFLAGIWKLDPHFPQNVWLLRLATFLWALAWFWLSYLFLRREAGSGRTARWLVLLVAALPSVIFLSITTVAGVMFAALATAALLLLERAESGDGSNHEWQAAGAGILGGAAFLARTIALPLLAAGAISLAARRKYRSAAAYVVLWLLLAAPWLVWQRVKYHRPPVEEAGYSLANYKDWNLIDNFSFAQKGTVIERNLEELASAPGLLIVIGPRLLPMVGWLMTALALWGWLDDRCRWKSSLWLFLPFYLGVVVLWAGLSRRFVIPIMPLVLYYAWRGLQAFCRRLKVSERKAAVACTVVLCLLLGNGLVRQARLTARDGEIFMGGGRQEWHHVQAVFQWVNNHTSRNAVFIAERDLALYLYTGRRALRGYNRNAYEMSYVKRPHDPLGTTAALAQAIVRQKVDYVLVGNPMGSGREFSFYARLIEDLRRNYPGCLQAPVKAAPGYVIYHVNRTALMQYGFSSPNPKSQPTT